MERERETEEKMTKANTSLARERLTSAEHPLFPSVSAALSPPKAIVRGFVDSLDFASFR